MKPLDLVADSRREPRRHQGAPIPLFDRLVDEDLLSSAEVPIKRYLNRQELEDSIRIELERILGTRSTLKKDDMGALGQEVENIGFPPLFGLSDFSQYDGARPTDHPKIAKLCEQAIRRYEPRLKNVVVHILKFDRHTSVLSIQIEAELVSEIYQGEVSFPLTLKHFL